MTAAAVRLASVRAVCFDLGGTVVSLAGQPPTTGRVAEALGLPLAEVRAWFERGPKRARTGCADLAMTVARHFGRPDAAPRLYTLLAQARRAAAAPPLYPDAIPVLTALRARGYPVFALSNALGSSAPHQDPAYYAYFDAVFPSYDTGLCKPERAAFATVERASARRPDELLHVGDSIRVDVQGAVDSGWHALFLDRGPGQGAPNGSGAMPPEHRITGLDGLLALLPALGSHPAASGGHHTHD